MKKITIVLTILLLSLVTINLSATNVSGLISTNTTWTLANSPYIVIGNILVNNGVTLTIEPGVMIKFNSGLSMQIDGELIAQGTSNNKITFTSNTTQTAGAWGYIYFSDASTDAVFLNNIYGNYVSGCILEYCIIQYAGGANVTNNGAIRLDNAHPFINYCNISYNSATGIFGYNLSASLKITNSSITHNSTTTNNSSGGMDIEGGTSLIENDTISDNITQGYGAGGINTTSSSTISHNVITNNITQGNGAGINTSSSSTISHNVITNNISSFNGGGICVSDGTNGIVHVISDNIIMNNTATGGSVGNSGGGIYYSGWANPVFGIAVAVSKNLIINNKANTEAGIDNDNSHGSSVSDTLCYNIISDNISATINGGIGTANANIIRNHIVRNTATNNAGISINDYGINSNIEFNTIAYNKNTDYNNNLNRSIYDISNPAININNNNIFNNSAFYEMYNGNAQGSANVAATNNWWGTADDATIQTKIYDWFDDNTLGIVNYSPYLATPDTLAPVSPPANISKVNIGGGQVKITWNHNPESDIAGYHLYYGSFTGYSFTNMIDVGNDTSYTLTGVAITDTIAITAYDRTYNIANELVSTIVNDNMTNGNESWYAYAAVSFPNGIKEIKSLTVSIYPNPASDIVSLIIDNRNNADLTLNIYNVIGILVKSETLGQNQRQINIRDLSNGIYMVEIKTKEWTRKQKLIIQR